MRSSALRPSASTSSPTPPRPRPDSAPSPPLSPPRPALPHPFLPPVRQPLPVNCRRVWVSDPGHAFFLLARRPGILVMVNDVDWELSGREETELEASDTVVFLSTLHGG